MRYKNFKLVNRQVLHTECDIVMMIEMFFHVLDRVFNSTTEQKIDLRRPTITVLRLLQDI